MGLSDYINQLTAPTNALGRLGKAISQVSGGPWGNALTLIDQQQRQGQEDAFQQQYRQAQLQALTAKQNRVQGVPLGNGGYGAFDPDSGQLNVLREPEAPRSPLQTSLEYVTSLPEGSPQRKLAERSLPNYGASDEAQAIRNGYVQQQIGSRLAGSLALKATPSASSRGGPVSPYGRSKANPLPVKSKADFDKLPTGAWVSPAPGVVFQKR